MAIPERLARGRVHYGWIIIAITFTVLLASAGARSTAGLLIVPLEQDLGWSRATISFAVSVNLVLYGLSGPFAAAMMETFGIRRMIAAALMAVALGVGLTPLMTAPWQLILLWGLVVGGGTGMTALALGAMVANRWFSERRGLVMGLLSASTATGQLLFLPVLASLVERQGWRPAMLVVAAVALAVLPLVWLFMRERPQEVGLRAYGEAADAPAPAPRAGNPFAIALEALGRGARSKDFWLLFGTFFVCGLSTNGLIGTHLIASCLDHGIPEVTSASLLAAMGIFDLVGTTASGWLSDRWNNRWLLFWYYGLRGLSLLYLPFALDLSFFGLSIFAIFYGLDWIATVPPTVRLTANVFGKENVGTMFGWIFAGHQLGAATAALGAGVLRVVFGTYLQAYMIAGLFCVLAALMALRIGVRPRGPVAPVEAPAMAG